MIGTDIYLYLSRQAPVVLKIRAVSTVTICLEIGELETEKIFRIIHFRISPADRDIQMRRTDEHQCLPVWSPPTLHPRQNVRKHYMAIISHLAVNCNRL